MTQKEFMEWIASIPHDDDDGLFAPSHLEDIVITRFQKTACIVYFARKQIQPILKILSFKGDLI